MRAVVLDADSLRLQDLDSSALRASVEECVFFAQTDAHEVNSRLQHADIAITNKVVLNEAVFKACPQLKLICVAATGTNNIDLLAAKTHGITVCNAQDYATESVAQHTLMLMLMLATQTHRYVADVHHGEWSRSPFFCLLNHPVQSLRGKQLTIVGAGNSGKRVAALAEAFGMHIRYAQLPHRPVREGRRPLAELLPDTDILSLHCPLTPDTTKLVNAELLTQLKLGAWLINVARGGLVDEPALAAALRSGQLGAAALDVLSIEPPPTDHLLLTPDIPNLIVTPHVAWASISARQTLLNQVAENIQAFRQKRALRVIVQ